VQRQAHPAGGRVRQGIACKVAKFSLYYIATLDVTAFVHRHRTREFGTPDLAEAWVEPRRQGARSDDAGSGWPVSSEDRSPRGR
jgi:hypothetical protein